jgi:hypothetical protein
MYKKYLRKFVAYLAGVLLWLALISTLQARCILNVPRLIDGLWTRQVNGNLVTNLTGSIAYQTTGLACDDKLIFLVRYYPNGVGGHYQYRTLTSMVDTKFWREVSSDSLSTTYVDKRYRYVLYGTSDGVYMRAFDI